MKWHVVAAGAFAVGIAFPAAAQFAAGPAPRPSTFVLAKGTPIQFRTRSPVSSRTAQLLDRVELEVVEDVVVGDAIVIPRGCQAIGEVSLVKGKGIWGASGALEIRLVSLNDDGHVIPVAGTAQSRGVAGAPAVIGGILFPPIVGGFYATGTSAVLPVGMLLSGVTEYDMALGGLEPRPSTAAGLADHRRPLGRPASFHGVPEWKLETGTAIEFRSLSAISSKLAARGDLFELEVVDDVLLNGEVIIPRGSRAVGEVIGVRRKWHYGRAGDLVAGLVSLRVNGRVLPLSGNLHAQGDPVGVGGVGNAGFGYSPFGYFVSGTSATIPAGTLMLGVTSKDLPLAQFDPKLRPPESIADGPPPARSTYQSFETPYTNPPPVIMVRTLPPGSR